MDLLTFTILIILSSFKHMTNADELNAVAPSGNVKIIYKYLKRVVFNNRYEDLSYDRYGWPIQDKEYHVNITCIPHYPIAIYSNYTYQNISGVHIFQCTMSNTPLADYFRSKNVSITNLNTLELSNTIMQPPMPLNYTAGLPLRRLHLSNISNFPVSPEFFAPLTDLRELIVENMKLPPLPHTPTFGIEVLRLKESQVNQWESCENFKELNIEGLKSQIPNSWPVNCTQLRQLKIEKINPEIFERLMQSFNETSLLNLKNLIVRHCGITNLPLHLIMTPKKLEHIDLSNNDMHDVQLLQLPTLNDLKVLNIIYNFNAGVLSGNDINKLLARTPSLRDFTFAIFPSALSRIRESLLKLPSLERLSYHQRFFFFDANTDYEVFSGDRFPKLTYYNWITAKPGGDEDRIRNLRLHFLPGTMEQHLTVQMSNIMVQFVSIGPEFVENLDYIHEAPKNFWLTNKGYKLTVIMAAVDCDCNNDVLWRVLREFPYFLAMPGLKCWDGGLFRDEPLENLSCRKITVNGCQRKMSRDFNYTTEVDCSNNVQSFRWPRPQGFRGLNASGIGITSLNKAYLPNTLKWLDLRNNNISRLSSEHSSFLFNTKDRKIWLARNPILCDCDNHPLLESLHANQSSIQDFDILVCADTGKPLRLVSVDELCRSRSVLVLVTTSVLAILALLTALLLRHYWESLKMILYAHGCCIGCFAENDGDDDRPYDAFLSFAHGDDKYVIEHLLPRLEDEKNQFRICVHYRDWPVGEWIPDQIMRSVRLSKRTIILLSKNFVNSCWGMLEFRHAYADAMASGRTRLLVLVLDDVLNSSKRLPTELQWYLELNTYLKCDDPWFWEKLQYALPHKGDKVYASFLGIRKCHLNVTSTEAEELPMEIIEVTERNENISSNFSNYIVTTT